MRAERKRGELPIGEALHPVALAAVVVLVVNDWVLKPSAAPGWLTGKLSDVAGLVFAPLVLTALVDAAIGRPLTRAKLAASIALTGAVFAAVKLSPEAARAVARAWSLTGVDARIVADPTDLLALPSLAVAWWIGVKEIRSTSDPRAARPDRP